MRTNWILTTAVLAMSVTAAAGAQSAKAMGKPPKGDTMSTTYTGCVESVNHGGDFLLTRVEGGGSMHDDKAPKDHDDMAMKGDAAMAMTHEQASMADRKTGPMAGKSFVLAGSTDLSRYVGHRVSVTGSLFDGSMGTRRPDLSTLTIKTLKVIAKSCS